jgi:hypothetical protein
MNPQRSAWRTLAGSVFGKPNAEPVRGTGGRDQCCSSVVLTSGQKINW